jgi:hypothetical protein
MEPVPDTSHCGSGPLGRGPDGSQRFLVFLRPFHYREALSGSGEEESLGNREIEGIATVGHRTTITLPGEWRVDNIISIPEDLVLILLSTV